MIFSGASLLLLLLLFVENVDQMDCVEWETGMVGGWWGDLFISSLESQTFSSTWRFEFDGKKKIFRWSPNRRRKSWANTFLFLCLRSISDAARVDTYTRSQEPPPLFAFASLHLYIYSPPHRNVFNRYVQSRVKGGGVGGKEAGYRGVVGWPRKFPTQLSIPNPDTSIIFDPLPFYL
jgi:hypothetical protein